MNVIDLHGLSYEDAKRKLELFINDNWGKEIKVITGNSESMKDLACNLASFYNLITSRKPFFGYIIIKGW